jgi:hypothetical protein
MTTRSGLRATIRLELNDGGGTPLWADGLLNEWIAEAIRDYSRNAPKQASTTLSSLAEQEEYALPADCLLVARVEHPAGVFRVPDPAGAGDVVADLSLDGAWRPVAQPPQLGYEVWGPQGARTLSLRPAPGAAGESIVVRYLAAYAEPSADGDTLATPSHDDDLLTWFVCNRALQWLGTDESKRQRFERQRGVSAQAAAGQYEQDYRGELRRRNRRAAPRRLVVRL